MPRVSVSLRPLSEKVARRFWSKVDRRDPDECWEWKGSRIFSGYGQFWLGARQLKAHRIAYELGTGEMPPDDLVVCHACDNPPCCNPAHLWLGTVRDNVQDMIAKGRQPRGKRRYSERYIRGDRHPFRLHPERIPRGDRHGSHTHPESVLRGERHGRARFTSEQVTEIRQRYAQGGITQKQLAAQYGVSRSAICHVLLGNVWKEEVE